MELKKLLKRCICTGIALVSLISGSLIVGDSFVLRNQPIYASASRWRMGTPRQLNYTWVSYRTYRSFGERVHSMFIFMPYGNGMYPRGGVSFDLGTPTAFKLTINDPRYRSITRHHYQITGTTYTATSKSERVWFNFYLKNARRGYIRTSVRNRRAAKALNPPYGRRSSYGCSVHITYGQSLHR